jgi:WD40 repeat protein
MKPYLLASLTVGLLLAPSAGLPQGGADKKADADRIAALILQLSSRKYATREAATRELRALGEPAWYPLRKAAAASPDEEARRRARQLAQEIGQRLFVEVRRFGGQGGYWLNRVAFTPDGRRAVATGGAVIVYDLASSKELFRSLELSFARPGLALSRDGRYFLTSHQNDWLVRLGDLQSGKEVRQFRGHTGGVFGVALSADGTRAASAGDDGTVRVWDVPSGKELRQFRAAGRARCVAFAPDGRHVLSGHHWAGSNNLVRLWDAEGGKEVRHFAGHKSDVTAVAFLPDGRSVLSASLDGTLRLWDAQTGKELRRMEHKGGVYDAKVSPDGRRALSAGFGDRTVRLWDLSDGGELHAFVGHRGAVLGVAFSPDGRQALSCDSQYTVHLWRLPPPESRPQ